MRFVIRAETAEFVAPLPKMGTHVVMVAISVIAVCCVTVIDGEVKENNDFAIRYLQKYGYLNEKMQSFRTTAERRILHHSISLFQEYYKLPSTGKLDNETLNQMRKPRCGLQDVVNHKTHAIGTKWPKTHLTWNFHLATEAILESARTAFNLWQANSSLTFERDVSHPNILISWREGNHLNLDHRNGERCPSPLDGPGGVLAHAAYPSGDPDYTSEIHVDTAEQWHILLDRNLPNHFNLLYVLTHEIGHSLGLSHNPSKDSIMYAFADEDPNPVRLSNEDILNIQNLYGASSNNNNDVSPTTTTTTPVSPTHPVTPRNVPRDLCELRHVDVILLLDKRMYVANGGYIWSIRLNDKTYGKPLLLSTYLKFLQPNYTRISAAYQTPSGHIMLFVNGKIYKVNFPSFSLVPSWPKTFAEFGLPADAKINAAVNTNQGRSYVIYNGYIVGEIDDCSGNIVKYQSIQAIFPGIPPNITSAFRYVDGNLYFTSKKQFYKFNEFTETVLSAGKFDLQIVDITCPRYGLLQQLRDLLNRIARTSDDFTNAGENSGEELT